MEKGYTLIKDGTEELQKKMVEVGLSLKRATRPLDNFKTILEK